MQSSAFDEIRLRITQVLDGSDEGDADAWTALDEDIRGALRYGGLPPAHTWFPGDGLHRRPGIQELAVALCGPDGRIREAALAYATDAPALLPLVAIRCADWAEPVRERARAVLEAKPTGLPGLPGPSPETLRTVASVILRVAGRRYGGAAAEMLGRLLREGPEAGVTALLASRDRRVRRLAHRNAVDRGLLSPARLAATATTDSDVVVRDMCANAVLAAVGTGDGAADGTPLTRLLAARQGRIRAAGVTGLRKADRAEEAEPFLYDRSALVRACARWVLRQAGTEPLPLYRAACAAGDGMPHRAPLGLAECGDRTTDAPVLWSLTGDERPPVRAAAVAGLRVLDAVRPGRIAPLLGDSSPCVVRETRKALQPWADHFFPVGDVPRRAAVTPSPQLGEGAATPLPEAGGAPHRDTAATPAPGPRAWIRRTLGFRRVLNRPR
ncbi:MULTISPECIES: hypothetical protein [unclassified Streptomyces]|uniref:hypothetical protein n=1 Tax=unclassified Streptomyces TaxID=2593676 RepID=UPI001656301C|nr:hypothetical protein [Streptomyces sp. CB02980]MCB8903314.1 hypothetical protein [Streptomyces sp. CB02980]